MKVLSKTALFVIFYAVNGVFLCSKEKLTMHFCGGKKNIRNKSKKTLFETPAKLYFSTIRHSERSEESL